MEKIYQDFSLNFTPHPITGDISLLSNEKSINQSIKNIIFRDEYETPFKKDFCGNVYNLLFELATPFIGEDIRTRITTAIANYEPRVDIQNVYSEFIEAENKLYVNIIYRAKTSTEDITVEYYLDRAV